MKANLTFFLFVLKTALEVPPKDFFAIDYHQLSWAEGGRASVCAVDSGSIGIAYRCRIRNHSLFWYTYCIIVLYFTMSNFFLVRAKKVHCKKESIFILTSEICACYATRLSHIHSIIAVRLLYSTVQYNILYVCMFCIRTALQRFSVTAGTFLGVPGYSMLQTCSQSLINSTVSISHTVQHPKILSAESKKVLDIN